MHFMLDIQVNSPQRRISYKDNILVIGSCFTEHIGGRLAQMKYPVLQNPHGILFDPLSVCRSILSYIDNKQYGKADLFQLNELWQSWQHHSIFSGIHEEEVLDKINRSQQAAYEFLQKANWLIITLGSSFTYLLTENDQPVANCHRAPSKWFRKHLTAIDEMLPAFKNCLDALFHFNPALNVVFTISPVRHIRDGVIQNNQSKARLIETVHRLMDTSDRLYYFPAYELVVDVLRDYRFYDIDLVHPNYAATEFVFEKFVEGFISREEHSVMEEVKDIVRAFNHRPFQPSTLAHRKFLQSYHEKVMQFQQNHPDIDMGKELLYFSGA